MARLLGAPRLGDDARRWSTVFPFGMYATCGFVAGDVASVGGPRRLRAHPALDRRRCGLLRRALALRRDS